MSELLPCPFCGGEATIDKYFSKEAEEDRFAVFHDCLYTIDDDRVSISTIYYDTEAEAIKAWNTRAERMCEIEHVKSGVLYHVWRCTGCGYEYAENVGEIETVQNYCPNCGAKVIKTT